MFRDIIILMKKKINEQMSLDDTSKKHGYHHQSISKTKEYSISSNASSNLSPLFTPKDMLRK
jgi:hypothetical protein